MQVASCDDIPKNAESNSSIESTALPWLKYPWPVDSEVKQSIVLQRAIFLTKFFPCLRFSQNASRDSDSAKRPLIPMMAIGSAVILRESLSCSELGLTSIDAPSRRVSWTIICSCQWLHTY